MKTKNKISLKDSNVYEGHKNLFLAKTIINIP